MATENIDVLGTLKKYILADGFDVVVDLEKSHDHWLYDRKRNTEYLDFFSFFASMPLGFNHPKMVDDQEFLKHLKLASLNKVSNSDFYTYEYAKFVDTFAKTALPKEFIHTFYISGGALAVENALKASFDWKVRKNIANGNGEIGQQVLHFKEAFHGRTGYTMSLTNTADPRKYMYFPKFDWPRVTNPKITFPLEKNIDKVKQLEEQSLNEITNAFNERKNDIAAIIIEPIQGEGGDNHFRPEFFGELRRIADENDAMLIFDEVQTGIGLTGKMWAYQHTGVTPDMIAFGKKMQVCGFVSTKRIDEIENNVFHESSRINSTWGGNLVDMVRSTKFLEIIAEENLVENTNKVGKYLLDKLYKLSEDNDNILTNIRGKGLFIAFDLPSGELRDKVKSLMFDEKVIVLGCGYTSIRLRPALDMGQDKVDIFLEKLEKVLKSIK